MSIMQHANTCRHDTLLDRCNDCKELKRKYFRRLLDTEDLIMGGDIRLPLETFGTAIIDLIDCLE